MPNPLQANQNDPWAWQQQAQTQDPGLYGWDKGGIRPDHLAAMKGQLQQAGLWKPEFDAYLNSQDNDGNSTQTPDLSSLNGYQMGAARSSGTNRLTGLFDPSGNMTNGRSASVHSSPTGADYAQMAGVLAGGYGMGEGLAAQGIGTGSGLFGAGGGGISGMDVAADAGIGSGNNLYTAGSMFGNGEAAGGLTSQVGSQALQPMSYNPNEFSGVMNASGASDGGMGTLGSGSSLPYPGMGSSALPANGYATGATFPTMASTVGSPGAGSLFGGMSTGNWLQLGSGALGFLGNQQAIRAGTNASNQSNQLQRDILNQQTTQNQPLIDTRNSALGKINALLADPSSIAKEPGYEFGRMQGQKQLDNNAAAAGNYYSGGQQKAASQYNTDYATTKLDQTYNRLAGVAGLGQVGSNNQGNALSSYGQTVGNNMTNAGNFRGSGYINGANQIGNALGGVANDWQTQQYLQNLRKGP